MTTLTRNALGILMVPFWIIACIVIAFSQPDEQHIQPKEWA
jgi:hypothetical protein